MSREERRGIFAKRRPRPERKGGEGNPGAPSPGPSGPSGPGERCPEVIYLTAKDLTMDSFPKYSEQPGLHSSGTGLHEIDFVGNLRYWSTFQTDVRAVFNNTAWAAHPQPLSVIFSSDIGPNSLDKEHFKCGAEISTSARYVQHVLHVMTAVGRELQHRLAFGDWGATQTQITIPGEESAQPGDDSTFSGTGSSKKIKDRRAVPDYVLIDAKSDAHAIGEAKHPWGTAPTRYVDQFLSGDTPTTLRRFLGQQARDLWGSDLKFGFMTNYAYTIFLKRDIVDGHQTLFFSDAISYQDKSIISPHPTPAPKVSLRECMLFLIHQASSNWQFPPDKKGDLNNWVHIKNPTPGDGKSRGSKSAQEELNAQRGIRPGPAFKPAGTDTPGETDTYSREPSHIRRQRAEQPKQQQDSSERNHPREHSRDIHHRESRPGEASSTQRSSRPERTYEERQARVERQNQGKRSLWEIFPGRRESVGN